MALLGSVGDWKTDWLGSCAHVMRSTAGVTSAARAVAAWRTAPKLPSRSMASIASVDLRGAGRRESNGRLLY